MEEPGDPELPFSDDSVEEEEVSMALADSRGRLLRADAADRPLYAGSGVVNTAAILRLSVVKDSSGGVRLRTAQGGLVTLANAGASAAAVSSLLPLIAGTLDAAEEAGVVFTVDEHSGAEGGVMLTSAAPGGGRYALVVGGDGRAGLSALATGPPPAAARFTLLRDPVPGATTARWALSAGAAGRLYAFWSPSAHAWLSSQPPPTKSFFGVVGGGSGTLFASAPALDEWESWRIDHVDAAAGTIGLRSTHGRFLASLNAAGELIADRQALGPWERFVLEHAPEGGVTLRREGSEPKQYLSTRNPARVNASAPERGDQETFVLYDVEASRALFWKGNPEDGPPAGAASAAAASDGGLTTLVKVLQKNASAIAMGVGAAAVIGVGVAAVVLASKASAAESSLAEEREERSKERVSAAAATSSAQRQLAMERDAHEKEMRRAGDAADAAVRSAQRSLQVERSARAREQVRSDAAIARAERAALQAPYVVLVSVYRPREAHCTRCGHTGHFTGTCRSQRDIYGRPLSRRK